jgi:ribonuclease BN (tRNA processing enzyme)
MKVTVVGCGDAWGSGGRFHTCFRIEAAGACALVDFGASALAGWHRLGFDLNDIDAIFLSHLHGDHFGGLPFLLLESQFEARRSRPLVIVGPPGARARIEALNEVLFPGVATRGWRFDWQVIEVEPGFAGQVAGFALRTAQVEHSSGAPCTALRLSAGSRTFAYSGDTAWTDALLPIADGADLFITECYSPERPVPGHLDWPSLRAQLPRLGARRIALTHLGAEALARRAEMAAAGVGICHDGAVFEL